MRDFYGYGPTAPSVRWPGHAPLAISFVLNIEEGAEFSVTSGDAYNEDTHEVRNRIEGAPDLCMESHFEYGARAGYWRIMKAFEQANIPITLNACARGLLATPWVVEKAVARGDELCCHGWRWEAHAGMALEDERRLIAQCVQTFIKLGAKAPVGWHTKSSPSVNTRALLVEHGGFLYDSDAYNDDLPYYLTVSGQQHLVLPYGFDTNDMRFFVNHDLVLGQHFCDYTMDAVRALMDEGADAPRMLTIGLHTRIIGRPGRIAGLQNLIRALKQLPVWFARREDIARHWLAHCPPSASAQPNASDLFNLPKFG